MNRNKILRTFNIDPEVWFAVKENTDNMSSLIEQLFIDWLGNLEERKKGKKELESVLNRKEIEIKRLRQELEEEKKKPKGRHISSQNQSSY